MRHRLHWSTPFVVTVLGAIVISTVADVILIVTGRQEHYIWGDELVDYWPLFGAFWYVVIIVSSKWLGHILLQRHEDFYEGGSLSADAQATEHPHEEEHAHG